MTTRDLVLVFYQGEKFWGKVLSKKKKWGSSLWSWGITGYGIQGSTNCMHSYEHAHNMHAKKFLHAWNYVHVN